jgi:pilus assembly protein CpaF
LTRRLQSASHGRGYGPRSQNLVSEIATEQRIQLNEIEEATLAAELTNDMIGLGPLEPYLEDDEVTDVLVNGPYDVYIERHGKLEKTPARFRDAPGRA